MARGSARVDCTGMALIRSRELSRMLSASDFLKCSVVHTNHQQFYENFGEVVLNVDRDNPPFPAPDCRLKTSTKSASCTEFAFRIVSGVWYLPYTREKLKINTRVHFSVCDLLHGDFVPCRYQSEPVKLSFPTTYTHTIPHHLLHVRRFKEYWITS